MGWAPLAARGGWGSGGERWKKRGWIEGGGGWGGGGEGVRRRVRRAGERGVRRVGEGGKEGKGYGAENK